MAMRIDNYGWYLIAAANLAMAVLIGSTITSFGLFVAPVATEYGLSRADVHTAFGLTTIGSALISPILGRTLDRFALRPMMMAAAVVFGSSLCALGLLHSPIIGAAIILFPLSFGFEAAGASTFPVLLVRWFKAYRARALALTFLGGAVGAVTVTPAMALAIEYAGWRPTLVALGPIAGAILLVIGWTMREQPRPDTDPKSSGLDPEAAELATSEPVRMGTFLAMRQFWWIALASAISAGAAGATLTTLVPFGQDAGLTLLDATALVSVAAVATVVGKVLVVLIGDAFEKATILAAVFLATSLFNLALYWSDSYATMLAAVALLGLAGGTVVPVYMALLAERFDAASFGSVRGLMVPISCVLGIAMARLAGGVYDHTGSYDAVFAIFAGAYAAAAIFMLAVRFDAIASSNTRMA